MRKKLTIDKWYGWMSSDPSVWGVGSFYDGRGVEIRKDSKKVTLAMNFSQDDAALNSRSTGWTVGAIVESLSSNLYATRDGKIANSLLPESIYWYTYFDSTYTTFYNMFRYYWPSDYGVIIASNGILRWLYDANSVNLWTLANDTVSDGDFSTWTWWTAWANWTISSGLATHTAWSTATLEQTSPLTVDDATKYIVTVKMASLSAGSFTVSMGGSVLGTVTTNEVYQWSRTTASTSEALVITPSTDFVGNIDSIYVQRSTVGLAVSDTLTSEAVILTTPNSIYIGNGDTLTKVDTTTTTWTSSDPVKVAQGYTIKGITKIGDQITIYASDGSNGKQYIWDWESPLPSREITWYDKPISRVLNLNNVDYIIVRTSKRATLYMVNWYQPELIAQSTNLVNTERDRFAFEGDDYINSIETIGNRLLIPTSGGLYSFWNIHPWYTKSIVREYTWNWGEPRTVYYSESSTAERIFVFYSSTKSGSFKNYIHTMSQIEEPWRSQQYSKLDPWFIRILPFFGTGYSQRKASVGYKIGAKIPTWTYVNIYSRADDETGYANFYTDYDSNPITVMPTVWAVYTNGSNTYTVTAITDNTTSAIIHCTYTWTNAVSYSGTLTKSSGTGDASVVYYRSNEFKLIKTLSNDTRGGQRFQYTESYNKLEWIVELFTTTTSKTPELYDFQYIFDEVEIDS